MVSFGAAAQSRRGSRRGSLFGSNRDEEDNWDDLDIDELQALIDADEMELEALEAAKRKIVRKFERNQLSRKNMDT